MKNFSSNIFIPGGWRTLKQYLSVPECVVERARNLFDQDRQFVRFDEIKEITVEALKDTNEALKDTEPCKKIFTDENGKMSFINLN